MRKHRISRHCDISSLGSAIVAGVPGGDVGGGASYYVASCM